MIVGIHGIGQQQLGRKQLLREWQPAVSDGIEEELGRSPSTVPFDLAFYGGLFVRKLDPDAGRLKSASGSDDFFEHLPDDEFVELADAVTEAIPDVDPAATDEAKKSRTRTPESVQSMLRALDARFGKAAGVLYLGNLRQVRRYLVDADLKARVDERVDRAVPPSCRVLIGHSLGSVVALEYVRRHPEHELDLLLTLGSPLGLRMVRTRLPDGPFVDRVSKAVKEWVNVRDPHDPVTCAGPLTTWWPAVREHLVDNEGDAHSATRYLSKRETGAALLAASPVLGDE